MILVQILLPLADNDGVPFPEADLAAVQAELATRFGGLTAHNRAPARGVWNHGGARHIVLYGEELGRCWRARNNP